MSLQDQDSGQGPEQGPDNEQEYRDELKQDLMDIARYSIYGLTATFAAALIGITADMNLLTRESEGDIVGMWTSRALGQENIFVYDAERLMRDENGHIMLPKVFANMTGRNDIEPGHYKMTTACHLMHGLGLTAMPCVLKIEPAKPKMII